jgi:prevent-host-death family protein
MPVLGVREFTRSASKTIESVASTREPVIITRHGKPTVAILALDADRWQSLAVAAAPQLLSSLRRADAALAAGQVQSLDEVIAELAPEPRSGRRRTTRRKATAAKRPAASGPAAARTKKAAAAKRGVNPAGHAKPKSSGGKKRTTSASTAGRKSARTARAEAAG